jgi:hypothetical protein
MLLNEDTTFNVDDNSGAAIDSLTIYFAVPVGEAAPVVTKFDFDNGPFTNFVGSLSNEHVWTPGDGSGQDLYSFVGCTGCNASINAHNVDLAENSVGVSGTPKFNVYNLVIDQGFASNADFETVDGLFSKGTIVAPFSLTGGKDFDTSWTNAGFVNVTSTSTVPESSTWAMLALGFAGLGFVGFRQTHKTSRSLA